MFCGRATELVKDIATCKPDGLPPYNVSHDFEQTSVGYPNALSRGLSKLSRCSQAELVQQICRETHEHNHCMMNAFA